MVQVLCLDPHFLGETMKRSFSEAMAEIVEKNDKKEEQQEQQSKQERKIHVMTSRWNSKDDKACKTGLKKRDRCEKQTFMPHYEKSTRERPQRMNIEAGDVWFESLHGSRHRWACTQPMPTHPTRAHRHWRTSTAPPASLSLRLDDELAFQSIVNWRESCFLYLFHVCTCMM